MMGTITTATTDTNTSVYKNKKTIKVKDTNDTKKDTDSKELKVKDIKYMSIDELLSEAIERLHRIEETIQELQRELG